MDIFIQNMRKRIVEERLCIEPKENHYMLYDQKWHSKNDSFSRKMGASQQRNKDRTKFTLMRQIRNRAEDAEWNSQRDKQTARRKMRNVETNQEFQVLFSKVPLFNHSTVLHAIQCMKLSGSLRGIPQEQCIYSAAIFMKSRVAMTVSKVISQPFIKKASRKNIMTFIVIREYIKKLQNRCKTFAG